MQQEELFEPVSQHKPWAELLRPTTLGEMVGQQHLIAPGMPLAAAFSSGIAHSMILWGPPGVGKTTLARLMAREFAYEFIALSAVFAGVKEVKAAVEQARQNALNQRQTILFIDEIHRFNKAQQDALLPYIEGGDIVFIGATTENPSFAVNAALLSRAKVYLLSSLTDADLQQLIAMVQQKGWFNYQLEPAARQMIVDYADGDGRKLLNFLENLASAFQPEKQGKVITVADIAPNISQNVRRFDKNGEQFYDLISALHKAVRGSNADAALYWFCRILDSSTDATYLMRRIIRMAWEDIGLADPKAVQLAVDAAASYERLGSPEGDLCLAQAVIYLAVAPKSNAGYKAFNQAMAFVKSDKSRQVPLHLRNAATKLMRDLGYGQNYRYAHDEPYGYAAGENYWPADLAKQVWYQPTDRGLEIQIAKKMAFLQQLDSRAQGGEIAGDEQPDEK